MAPSEEILRLAHGVDVLIHEATTAQDLEKEANKWGHSSAHQAAEIASEARVGELIITHFSSRYPDVTPLEQEARETFPQTIAAYDLLTKIIKQK
jgi:ribonuclease Z